MSCVLCHPFDKGLLFKKGRWHLSLLYLVSLQNHLLDADLSLGLFRGFRNGANETKKRRKGKAGIYIYMIRNHQKSVTVTEIQVNNY